MENLCDSYEKVRPELKAFDLVFFKGVGFSADLIRLGEWMTSTNKTCDPNTLEFSHVGIVLTSDLLQGIKNVQPNELYLWESTLNDRAGIGVPDINGKYLKGVQLRDLDSVIIEYNKYNVKKAVSKGNKPKDSYISIALLDENSRDCVNKNYATIKADFPEIFTRYQDIRYDAQPLSLLGSMFECFRWEKLNDEINETLGSKDWLFCSELVTVIFKEVGIFPNSCKPGFVVPTDLLGHDRDKIEDGGVPLVIKKPINLMCNTSI